MLRGCCHCCDEICLCCTTSRHHLIITVAQQYNSSSTQSSSTRLMTPCAVVGKLSSGGATGLLPKKKLSPYWQGLEPGLGSPTHARRFWFPVPEAPQAGEFPIKTDADVEGPSSCSPCAEQRSGRWRARALRVYACRSRGLSSSGGVAIRERARSPSWEAAGVASTRKLAGTSRYFSLQLQVKKSHAGLFRLRSSVPSVGRRALSAREDRKKKIEPNALLGKAAVQQERGSSTRDSEGRADN